MPNKKSSFTNNKWKDKEATDKSFKKLESISNILSLKSLENYFKVKRQKNINS